MAVTGLGDWPISSQWFSDANGLVFCTRTSFVNKSSNDPLDDMMVDYFFSAAAGGGTVGQPIYIMMMAGSGSGMNV